MQKIKHLLSLLLLLVCSTSVWAAIEDLEYKSLQSTALIYTSPANLKALGYAQDGKGAQDYSAVSSRGKAPNPEDESDANYDIGATGTYLKSAGSAKEVLLYITNVSQLDVYTKDNSGNQDRYAKIVATPSDGTANVTVTGTVHSGRTSATLDPKKSYKVSLVSSNASDITLYAIRMVVSGGKTVSSVVKELTDVKVDGTSVSSTDLASLTANKTLSVATEFSYVPKVTFSVTTTKKYTDGTDDGGSTANNEVTPAKDGDNFVASYKVDETTYSVTLTNVNYIERYALVEKEVELSIMQDAISKNGYLSTTTENWNSGYYNLSSVGRDLTIKVSGVEKFALKVKNGTAGRTYGVYVGDNKLASVNHPGKVDGSDVILSDVFETGSTGNVDIIIKGEGESVYPASIILYAPEGDPYDCTVSFSTGDAEGIAPANIVATNGTNVTIPANYTLYKEGYTLTGWTDNTNTYNIGESINSIQNDIALTPVFTANTKNINERAAAVTVNWEFRKNQGVPQVGWEGKSGFLVAQAEVNGETIDVKLAIDATSGKFNNSNGEWAQINSGTKLTVPSAKGAVISTYVMGDPTAEAVINGQSYDSFTNNVASWTMTGEETTATLTTAGGTWYQWIKVVLPKTETVDPTPGAYDNVDATIAWTVGNETAGAVTSDAAAAISNTKVKAAAALSTTVISNYDANNGNAMVAYTPASSNPGCVADAMIEYTIKMQKGTTFTLTNLSYDAIKDGTDNASYSWSYTVDGIESVIAKVDKDNILRNNNVSGTPALNHVETITADAGQTVTVRFYVSDFANNKKFALSNIKINGKVNGTPEARSFKDFKIEFRNDPYTVVAPAEGLPEGVEVNVVAYHDAQHGVKNNSTITVPVDGPVKFTIGGCGYSNGATVKVNGGAAIAIDTKSAGCDGGAGSYDHFATYTYNVEETATLVFDLGGYCPYFFAEACEFIPTVDVTYYDTDGKTVIGTKTVEGSSALEYAYGADDVTVAPDKAFRGWFSSAALEAVKIKEGVAVNEDLKLYAKATDIEVVTPGSVWNYELNKTYFYQEDHELINMTNGSFHDGQHGWSFSSNGTLELQVAGNAIVNFSLCSFSKDTESITCVETGESVNSKVAADGGSASLSYKGEATTLHFNVKGGYIHAIKVFNIDGDLPEKNAAGYYVMNSGDGAGLLTVLANAQAGDKIFLPNGTYDFGETCLTTVPAGVSLIGQSQDGVIIKNTPLVEGIGVTATLMPGGNNYMQDLSIKCSADKCATPSASRCVTIQDKSTRNVFKNVSLLSGQDTYYSNGNEKQQSYFENCYITGTVDFICGGGDIVFKNSTFYCNERSGNVIFAPSTNPSTKWGYVALDCTVDGHAVNNNSFNIGRDWQGSPAATLINTEFKIMPTAAGYTKMSNSALVLRFHEYNSHKTDGTAITGHNFNALVGGSTYNDNLYLSAADAANYTLANIFAGGQYDGVDAWNPAAITAQATADATAIDPEAAYLVENNGEFVAVVLGSDIDSQYNGMTIRKANGRGGFGEAEAYTSGIALKLNTSGYATFSAAYPVQIEGAKAYTATVSGDKLVCTEIAEGLVPAGVGVLLYGEASASVAATRVAEASAITTANELQATTLADGSLATKDTENVLVLSGNTFKPYSGAAFAPNKAYLPYSTNASKAFTIVFGDTTGINAVEAPAAAKAVKTVKNGKLVISVNGVEYNAVGAVLK